MLYQLVTAYEPPLLATAEALDGDDWQADEIFMSDVTAAIFGLGSGGVTPGQTVLERVAPDHRDRLRQALSTAAIYGVFDVSFRTPAPENGRAVWVEARGQAFGQPTDEGPSGR